MDNFEIRIEKLEQAIPKYAKAKADRVYIEKFLKSKKAILMNEAASRGIEKITEREQYAYSHAEYIELLEGLRAATEIEEKHRWALEALKIDVEIWRTTQANERFMKDRV